MKPLELEEWEQTQANYIKSAKLDEARAIVFIRAIKWYEAGMELDAKIKSGEMDGYEVCQRKTWDAEQALADAVKHWKEAQA